MPWITMSVTLPRPLAMVCQPCTTTLRNGSVLVQPLCSDSDLTFCGCLTASHMPVAAPNDRPETCARSMPTACINAATSSANNSVEYVPAGLSVSPAPRGSTDMQVKCFAYSAT